MNAQKQRKNTVAAVVIIVLILLVVLGIGLYFLFNKPTPADESVPPVAETPTETPAPTATPTPEVPASAELLGVHKVVPKDTLWWISDKWYKDPVLWPSIYEINRSQIKDPDQIYPGQNFDIPALSGTPGNLSPEDKTLLSQGYLEAYRVYKEKGKKDAEDYKVVGEKYSSKK